MTLPDWLEPMAATLTQERFAGPEWTFEQKFDGIAALVAQITNDVAAARGWLKDHPI